MKTITNIIYAVFALFAFGCFALLPTAQGGLAVPPPDGCYPGFTTAEGCDALHFLTTGAGNTGLGWRSLFFNTSGSFSTGVGAGTLVLNNADSNTATGAAALLLNTTGTQNVATGTDALVHNDSGNFNNAMGAFALFENVDGSSNNALGGNALLNNISGINNTAIGDQALSNNDSDGMGLGNNNTAVGVGALFNNVDGDYITSLGANTGTDPDIVRNNIYIGDPGFAGDENVISIGGIAASGTDFTATYIGGIYGAAVNAGSALTVYVDTDGHLGTSLVNAPGRKVRARSPQRSQPQAVLGEFQKQQKRITELENTVARLAATVKEQAAQIQKVSAQLEASRPAPQIAVNNQQ